MAESAEKWASKRSAKTGAPRKVVRARGLSPKRRRFVKEYLVDLNATQVTIRAGYSPRSASTTGERLLRNAEVAEAIQKAMDARSARTDIQVDDVLRELAILGFSDVRHFTADSNGNLVLADGAPEDAWRAVSSVKRRIRTGGEGHTTVDVELKLWDKPSSLKMLGQHLHMFVDLHKHDHAGRVEVSERDPRLA